MNLALEVWKAQLRECGATRVRIRYVYHWAGPTGYMIEIISCMAAGPAAANDLLPLPKGDAGTAVRALLRQATPPNAWQQVEDTHELELVL